MVGTDGAPRMTNGTGLNVADRADLIKGGGLILIGAVLVVVVNALTTLWDTPDASSWEPWVWEVSSLIGLASAIWIPWLASAKAPADEVLSEGWGPRLHFAAVHLIGVVGYAALHVLVFVTIRHVAYAAMGSRYEFGGQFLFEFRKDLLSYLLFLSIFWGVAHVRHNAKDEVRPVSFDIRDGARIIRVPVAEILAVTAAGNYVEFVLADGRRPLMRATLSAVEAQLRAVGFVRTHRSWLVNADRVCELSPAGSGDWIIKVAGVEVPLSRRYPDALERLKP